MIGQTITETINTKDGQSCTVHDSCLHCGQKLLTSSERLSGFCCIGCLGVYSFIGKLGLDRFYDLRDGEAKRSTQPINFEANKFLHLDDHNFEHEFIEVDSVGISKITFYLTGIHCSACIWLLEKLPQVIPGILSVRADIVRSTVSVRYVCSSVKPSHIAHTLQSLGYKPQPQALRGESFKVTASHDDFALKLGVAAFCSMNVMILFIARYQGLFTGMEQSYASFFAWISFILATPAVLYSAQPFYLTSLAGLKVKKFHIDLPIAVAIVAGYAASAINTILGRSEIYFDTVTALVFLLLCGRWVQHQAIKKVAQASDLLYELAPLNAHKVLDSGAKLDVFIRSLKAGDVVEVFRNERLPCDGTVLSDKGLVNNGIITGESTPVSVTAGTPVWTGSLNLGSTLKIAVKAIAEQSRLGQLLSAAQSAPTKSSKIVKLTDKISVGFVIAVFALAALTFIINFTSGFWVAWDRVIALLVVSCPCALGIATPITLSLASSQAAKDGFLLRSGDSLERLAKITDLFFDKTGTLTTGSFALIDTLAASNINWNKTWQIIRQLEKNSSHPIAMALNNAADRFQVETDIFPSLQLKVELSKSGVIGSCADGTHYMLGSIKWLSDSGVNLNKDQYEFIFQAIVQSLTVIGLSQGNHLQALFALGDPVRADAKYLMRGLIDMGINPHIISGDMSAVTKRLARELGIAEEHAHGDLTPEDKARIVSSYNDCAGFVGDGVNDALGLVQAGVGIGISGGAEVCLQVADIYLVRPDLNLILKAIRGSKNVINLIYRNLGISLLYNLTAAIFAISGQIGPLAAALIMPASSLTVILSSIWAKPFSAGRSR